MKIFNIKQANIFIQNGATPIGCGLGLRGKIYIEFQDNDLIKTLMIKWMAREI